MPDELIVSAGTAAATDVKKTHAPKRPSILKFVGIAIGIAVAVALFLAPSTQHIPASTRAVMGVLGLTIVFWTCRVGANYEVALIMFALFLLIKVPPQVAFFGFIASPFWVMFAALYFGFAMTKTGLAQRIALKVLKLFKPSYTSILFAFFLIGAALSLAITSATVRVAVIVPLAWSIVKKTRLSERSAASALIVISAFEMAILPGFGTTTGTIANLQFATLFHELGLRMSWLDYTKAAAVPALLCSLLVLGGNLVVLRPNVRIGANFSIADELAKLGNPTKGEKYTLLIISGSLVLWATQRWHGIDEATVALFGLIALLSTGVLGPGEFERGISWELLIFFAAIFTIVKVIPTYGIDELIRSIITTKLEPHLGNVIVALMLIPPAVFVFRLVEPAGVPSTMMVFLALYRPLVRMGTSPLVTATAAMLSLVPFWFLYQNVWLAMSDGMTEHKAFTQGQQAKAATIYAVAVLLSLLISVGYWHEIGLIPRLR